MALRPYSTLISLFPILGKDGAYPEGKAAPLPFSLTDGLHATQIGYNSSLSAAIKFWTENNDRIVPFMAKEDRLGALDAICAVVSNRHAWLTARGFGGTADIHALEWARRVKQSADQLRLARYPLSTSVTNIYRGEAIEAAMMATTYSPGQIITWALPKACTINPDVVPLHFAWKQCNPAFTTLGSPTGILLDISLDPTGNTALLWAGWVSPSSGRADMRWQQEVIVHPDFRFKVISCVPVAGAAGPLYQVRARQVR